MLKHDWGLLCDSGLYVRAGGDGGHAMVLPWAASRQAILPPLRRVSLPLERFARETPGRMVWDAKHFKLKMLY